jgi:broad specificity phosphatase PhoE
MKELYFIRHGQTEYNIQKRSQGSEVDSPLTQRGALESKLTGIYLNEKQTKHKKYDAIFCSPIGRASQTAKIIATMINFSHDDIIYDDLITENKAGLFSGKTKAEMQKDNNFDHFFHLQDVISQTNDPIDRHYLYEQMIQHNTDHLKRESYGDLDKRVSLFLKNITDSKYKNIIIVTHSGLLGAINEHVSHMVDLPNGDVSNGSNCTIEYMQYTKFYDNIRVFKIITLPNTTHFDFIVDWSSLIIGKIIGSGVFGKTYEIAIDALAKWNKNTNIVMKRRTITIDEMKNEDTTFQINRMIDFFKLLNVLSPDDIKFFIRLYAYRKYNEQKEYLIDMILERKQGTVYEIIESLTKNQIMTVFIQSLYALYIMNTYGYYHCDAKSDNICYSEISDTYLLLGKFGKIQTHGYQISLIDYDNVLNDKFVLDAVDKKILTDNVNHNVDLWNLIDSILLRNTLIYNKIKTGKKGIKPKELMDLIKLFFSVQYNKETAILEKTYDNLDELRNVIRSDSFEEFKKYKTSGYEVLQWFQILFPSKYIDIIEKYFNIKLQHGEYNIDFIDNDLLVFIKLNGKDMKKIINHVSISKNL